MILKEILEVEIGIFELNVILFINKSIGFILKIFRMIFSRILNLFAF